MGIDRDTNLVSFLKRDISNGLIIKKRQFTGKELEEKIDELGKLIDELFKLSGIDAGKQIAFLETAYGKH